MTYSLDETASLLRLPTVTLLFWEEAFHNELNVRRGAQGELCFEDHHLRAIGELRNLILNEKRPLHEARWHLANRIQLGENGGDTLDSDCNVSQTDGRDEKPAQPPPTHSGIDELQARVSELTDKVNYLLEENRALQELIGRLIHFVERLGESPREVYGSEAEDRGRSAQGAGATPSMRSTGGAMEAESPGQAPLRNPPPASMRVTTQVSAPAPAGPPRPKLTLAERRAQIVAQREAARAQTGGSQPLETNTLPGNKNHLSKSDNGMAEKKLRPWRPRKLDDQAALVVNRSHRS